MIFSYHITKNFIKDANKLDKREKFINNFLDICSQPFFILFKDIEFPDEIDRLFKERLEKSFKINKTIKKLINKKNISNIDIIFGSDHDDRFDCKNLYTAKQVYDDPFKILKNFKGQKISFNNISGDSSLFKKHIAKLFKYSTHLLLIDRHLGAALVERETYNMMGTTNENNNQKRINKNLISEYNFILSFYKNLAIENNTVCHFVSSHGRKKNKKINYEEVLPLMKKKYFDDNVFKFFKLVIRDWDKTYDRYIIFFNDDEVLFFPNQPAQKNIAFFETPQKIFNYKVKKIVLEQEKTYTIIEESLNKYADEIENLKK